MSTSSGSEAWNGSGRGNWGLGRGKESGGNCGSGSGLGVGGAGLGSGGLRGAGDSVPCAGVGGLRGADDSGRGSGSAWGGASSQDDDVCEAIHAPVGGVGAEADGGPTGFIGGVAGDACPRRAEAGRRVGTSRVEREEEWDAGVGEEGGVCAAGAAGRCAG